MKCPKCKQEYKGKPALSRLDSKTEICELCGYAEAIAIANSVIENRKVKISIKGLSIEERKLRKELENILMNQKVAEK